VNDSWHSHLSDIGGEFNKESGTRFGSEAEEVAAASTGNILADLSHLALIRASGEDARTFLLSQLTNDLDQVSETHSQISAYCTPKGRMLALFRIVQYGDELLLQAPASIVDAVLPRLRMYVMRAKVNLDLADDLVSVGVSGPEVESLLQPVVDKLPVAPNDTVQAGSTSVTRLDGPHPRFLIIGQIETVKQLWQQLSGNTQSTGKVAWSWLDISAGLPSVVPETTEAFVPQMVNLDVIDGVNFKKGCYPGQEIVARMQYLGKLKQRMYRAHATTETPPAQGSSVFAPSFRDQSAGTIVDAQPSPSGGVDLLAVIQIKAVDEREIHLGATEGPLLEILELPYELPTAKEA
jgi:folate-binding protein YgfZ